MSTEVAAVETVEAAEGFAAGGRLEADRERLLTLPFLVGGAGLLRPVASGLAGIRGLMGDVIGELALGEVALDFWRGAGTGRLGLVAAAGRSEGRAGFAIEKSEGRPLTEPATRALVAASTGAALVAASTGAGAGAEPAGAASGMEATGAGIAAWETGALAAGACGFVGAIIPTGIRGVSASATAMESGL